MARVHCVASCLLELSVVRAAMRAMSTFTYHIVVYCISVLFCRPDPVVSNSLCCRSMLFV